MKKKLLLIIGLTCMLGLSGCGDSISCPAATEAPAATGNPVTTDNPAMTNTQSTAGKVVLKEAPTLSVICGETKVETLQGTRSWYYQNGDGTSTGVEIDSIHPLEAKDLMQPLSLTPSYLSHVDPFAAYLQFEVAPDSVQVSCWSEYYWGQSNAYDKGENLNVTSVETVQADGTTNRQYQFDLKDGNYIYLISAKWDSSELYKGSSDYSFYTVNPLTQTMPIAKNTSPYIISESYDFNHNGTAEVLTLTSGDADTIEDATYWTMTLTENGQELWHFTAGVAHVGWGSIFAVEIDDKDYLMYYSPHMNQGYAGYNYHIFSLDTQNKEVIKQKNSVSFDINFGSPLHESFDPAAIAQFMQEVEALLEKSTLLFSTEGGTLQLGGSGADFKEDEAWLESGYDPSKSLEENLKLFEKRHTQN